MNEKTTIQRRWHDNRGDLSILVDILDCIPEELHSVIVEGINERAEKHWQIEDVLKSLGAKKVLALHKSKKKARSYDKKPVLHKAMTYFFVLPEEKQDALATDGLCYTRAVLDYIAECKAQQVEPSRDDLRKMRQFYVAKGSAELVRYIEHHRPKQEQPLIVPEESVSQDISQSKDHVVDEQEGMKISSLTQPTAL